MRTPMRLDGAHMAKPPGFGNSRGRGSSLRYANPAHLLKSIFTLHCQSFTTRTADGASWRSAVEWLSSSANPQASIKLRMASRVLIVEDDPAQRRILEEM